MKTTFLIIPVIAVMSATVTTLDDKTEKLGITLPIGLVKQTDIARGDIPRSTFIRRAPEQYIKGKAGK